MTPVNALVLRARSTSAGRAGLMLMLMLWPMAHGHYTEQTDATTSASRDGDRNSRDAITLP